MRNAGVGGGMGVGGMGSGMKKITALVAAVTCAALIIASPAGASDTYRKKMMEKDWSARGETEGTGEMGRIMGIIGMGMGMGMMGCPMMDEGVAMEVKKLDDGVSITYRSDDKDTRKRLQIMGDMMKLMREMMDIRSGERKEGGEGQEKK